MPETQEKNQNPPMTESGRLEAMNKTKPLKERADKGRQFLADEDTNINKIATDLSLKPIANPSDDSQFVGLVIKIQAKLGFKPVDSGSGQDGIFGRKTFEAYKNFIDRSNKEQTQLATSGKKLAGPSREEIDSINEDQLALARLDEELEKVETTTPDTPKHIPSEQHPPATVAPRPVEPLTNPEMTRLGVELKDPSEICFIGDSNATRMARKIPGAKVIGEEGKTSASVLKMLTEEQGKLKGVRLVVLRVGGNDGGKNDPLKLTPEQTLENINKIVAICKSMGVKEVRIITRQPFVAQSGKRSLAQRKLTLAKYGDGKITDAEGTNVAVVDLYGRMVDKNARLPKAYAHKDGLHMSGKGYSKALGIIADAIGAPQIARWAGEKS